MGSRSLLGLLCVFCSMPALSQVTIGADLKQRLATKGKFYEIYDEVEKFYREQKQSIVSKDSLAKKKIDRQRKFWNRWHWYWESRINSDGSFPDVTNRVHDVLKDISTNSAMAPDPSSGVWNLVGPSVVDNAVAGRVDRIAFHPTLPGTIYIGTPSSGLWRSNDFGASWINLTAYVPSLGISGIVVSYDNPNTIYVLTGDGDSKIPGGFVNNFGYLRSGIGVLKSADNGLSWQRTGLFRLATGEYLSANSFVGYKLKQHPANPLELLAATDKGIFRTGDGGLTWNQCLIGGPSIPDTQVIFDIEYKPGDGSVVYAAGTSFFRSTDGGANFAQLTGGDLGLLTVGTPVTRIDIAVTPANPLVVYLLAGPGNLLDGGGAGSSDSFKGVFRSTDSGISFFLRASSPDILGYESLITTLGDQSVYDLALAAKPTAANTIITGGLVVWKSVNGGIDYTEETDYFEDIDDSDWIHPDVHDLAYNPIDPGRLYAATDGGIWVSTDDAFTWSSLNNGLSLIQFYKMEKRSEDNNPWGGSQDNGTLWYSGTGAVFNDFDGGDGFDVLTDVEQDDKFWVVNKEIWTDGIVSSDITPPGVDEFFPLLAHDFSNDADKLYAGFSGTFITSDHGSSWNRLQYSEAGSTISVPGNWALQACPNNNTRLYCAGRNPGNIASRVSGLWRIDNITGTNTASYIYNYLGNKPGFPSSGMKITDIAVHPGNSFRVWITMGGFANGHVYFSNDAGENWVDVSGSLPDLPVNCVEVDAFQNVFIGTDIGVYFRTTGMSDWAPYYNNLPRVPVTDLDLWATSGTTYLDASTFGRGIWRTVVDLTCDPNLVIDEPSLGGALHFQAGNSIQSAAFITGGFETQVFFKAGSFIQLNPGFEVKAGSAFNASIGACNAGGVPILSTQETNRASRLGDNSKKRKR